MSNRYNHCPKNHWLGWKNFFQPWKEKPCPKCEEEAL